MSSWTLIFALFSLLKRRTILSGVRTSVASSLEFQVSYLLEIVRLLLEAFLAFTNKMMNCPSYLSFGKTQLSKLGETSVLCSFEPVSVKGVPLVVESEFISILKGLTVVTEPGTSTIL